MPFTKDAPIIGFAFALGGDGAGTFFVFVGAMPDGYKVIATIEGAQAQVRFGNRSPGHFLKPTNLAFGRNDGKHRIAPRPNTMRVTQ
jgi:hypothetical protein